MIGMDNKVIRAVISIFAALGAFVVAFLSVFIPWMISDTHHAPHDGQNGMAGFLVGIPAGLLDIGTLADLSNIGTLFAFALVAGGVLILRYKQPDRPRAFRAPGGILAPVITILTCLLLMAGLPITNWIRFFVWLLIGLCFYYFYGRRHSQLSDANIAADADRDKDKLR